MRVGRGRIAPTWRSCAAVVALTAAGWMLSACGAGPGPDPGPSQTAPTPAVSASVGALPAGVQVELRQSRADVAARQAMLSVTNGSERVVEVGSVSIDDPRFEAPAERVVARTSRVPAGATVDIRLQLADVRCDVPDTAQVTAALEVSADGGAAATVTVPVVDRVPFLSEFHERECLQQQALRSAAIELDGFEPSPSGTPAALRLTVTPAPGIGALRITGIRETNLLTFEGVVDGVHRLDLDQTGADRETQSVDLPLLPLRCDPHAVQEDKRGTVFRLFVEVDGAPGSFDLAATPTLRGEILDWIAAWCAF